MGTKERKFLVPATWLVSVDVVVTAKDEDEAIEKAQHYDPRQVEDITYIKRSFDADVGMVEELDR